jgi:hypothetical protein
MSTCEVMMDDRKDMELPTINGSIYRLDESVSLSGNLEFTAT